VKDVWSAGESYEPYVGRWSRLVADEFIRWLDLSPGSRSVDVGCGTGALTSLLADIGPATGIDPSAGFVAYAAAHTLRAEFLVGDALALPFDDGRFDAAVSGLVLNFVPDPSVMVAEMKRVVRPGGVVGLYVWDYAEGMELMRLFWDVAVALDAAAPDEASRFPVCAPEPLAQLFQGNGLTQVAGRPIVVATRFSGFEDYWRPFLGGQGPAPAYLARLDDGHRERLRVRLRRTLPVDHDGGIPLTARAWAVRGLS